MIIPPFDHDHANGTLGKAFHIDHSYEFVQFDTSGWTGWRSARA
jgi:hypothetical protein